MTRIFTCKCCRRVRPANPRLKNQEYCGEKRCQQARKREWQKHKMATDPDYQANQRDAQKAWRECNPDYWRKRRQAKVRPTASREGENKSVLTGPVKMDALTPKINAISGEYVIVPILRAGVKMDALRVIITPISTS